MNTEKLDDVEFQAATAEAVGVLELEKAIELVKFYEAQAGTVKTRTWTITTWILTLNTSLLGFGVKLYTNDQIIPRVLDLQSAIAVVGSALCVFLIFLLLDQGNHLKHYWLAENRVGAWNEGVRALVVTKKEYMDGLRPEFRGRFPLFCTSLLVLTGMFLLGFVGFYFLMADLEDSRSNNRCEATVAKEYVFQVHNLITNPKA